MPRSQYDATAVALGAYQQMTSCGARRPSQRASSRIAQNTYSDPPGRSTRQASANQRSSRYGMYPEVRPASARLPRIRPLYGGSATTTSNVSGTNGSAAASA